MFIKVFLYYTIYIQYEITEMLLCYYVIKCYYVMYAIFLAIKKKQHTRIVCIT